jgi:hypothetical protein
MKSASSASSSSVSRCSDRSRDTQCRADFSPAPQRPVGKGECATALARFYAEPLSSHAGEWPLFAFARSQTAITLSAGHGRSNSRNK